MNHLLFLTGVILIFCAIFQKLFRRTGVPGLFLFIAAGMIFGSDGLFRIPFEDYDVAGTLCSAALVLIIYYGGLGTNLKAAKPVLAKAVLLSSAGSLLTALLVSGFAIVVLGMTVLEGLLLGAVICSTDAASVFSILRSRKMDLRYGTASLLEVESGSNDPVSYLLTMVVLSLLQGNGLSTGQMIKMLLLQIVVGA
ncbi:cation:proton antiporter, partial [Galactobacillus timonensis]